MFEVRDLWPESLDVIECGFLRVAYWTLEQVVEFLYRHVSAVSVVTPGMVDAVVARGADPGRY